VTRKHRADKILDVRGWSYPWCILKTKSELKHMHHGQVLEVLGTDPQAIRNLPAVLDRAGDGLLAVEEGPEFFRLYLRKGTVGTSDDTAEPLTERKGGSHGSN